MRRAFKKDDQTHRVQSTMMAALNGKVSGVDIEHDSFRSRVVRFYEVPASHLIIARNEQRLIFRAAV
jgi:hypothetical protein